VRKTGGVGAKHRKVCCRVSSDHGRGYAAPIYECHSRGLRALDDVLIGEDVSVWRDDNARPGAAACAIGIIRAAAHIHTDNSRANAVDGSHNGG
jgi:hypothetical protein